MEAHAYLALEALRAAVKHSAVNDLFIRDIFESIQLLQEADGADFRHRCLEAGSCARGQRERAQDTAWIQNRS